MSCIANCVSCILGGKKEGKKEGMLHPINKSDVPLHRYHVDHLGPLASTNKNYKHTQNLPHLKRLLKN